MASTRTTTTAERNTTSATDSTVTEACTGSDPLLIRYYATVAWKMPAAFQTISNVPAEDDWLAPKST